MATGCVGSRFAWRPEHNTRPRTCNMRSLAMKHVQQSAVASFPRKIALCWLTVQGAFSGALLQSQLLVPHGSRILTSSILLAHLPNQELVNNTRLNARQDMCHNMWKVWLALSQPSLLHLLQQCVHMANSLASSTCRRQMTRKIEQNFTEV